MKPPCRYKEEGRRVNLTNNGVLSTFIVDNKNELTNAPVKGTIWYDSNGNMTGNSAGDSFQYDDENRLIEAGIYAANFTTGFQYDGLGRLRQRTDISGIVGPLNSQTWCNYIYEF